MTINSSRNYFIWKPVKGDIPKRSIKCPRCNNLVDYTLSWDGAKLGWGEFGIAFSKVYAYKCPICPNFEAVSPEQAKAIIKGA